MPINFFYTGTCNKTEFSKIDNYVKQLSIYVEREATVECTNLFFNANEKNLSWPCMHILINTYHLFIYATDHSYCNTK